MKQYKRMSLIVNHITNNNTEKRETAFKSSIGTEKLQPIFSENRKTLNKYFLIYQKKKIFFKR